jgi:hypothetical protein
MNRLLWLFLALSLPLYGDSLDDVRAAVRRLGAKQPVHGTLTIAQNVASAGRFANDKTARQAAVEVTHDAAGVSMTIPQALLDELNVEATARGKVTTAQDAINSFRPDLVIETLNFRNAFLRMLDGATLKQQQQVTYRGRPARLLVLKLVTVEEKKPGRIQLGSVENEDILKLWVDEQSVPLAADRQQKGTAGFMFLKGTFASHVSYLFGVAQDRLVVLRVEANDSGSGLGQNVQKQSTQTLTLH